MLDEFREACGEQVGVTSRSPLQTHFKERPSPVSTPHPSITFLAFAIRPSALLRLFHVHGVYRACSWTRVEVTFPLCCQLYNDAYKTPLKRFFPLSVSIGCLISNFYDFPVELRHTHRLHACFRRLLQFLGVSLLNIWWFACKTARKTNQKMTLVLHVNTDCH